MRLDNFIEDLCIFETKDDIMRQILTLLFVFVSVHIANAQFAENHAIYLSGETGGGNYFNTDLNLNYVFKENYSLQVGLTGNLRKPISQPDDYFGGLLKTVFFFGLADPKDMLETYHISAGKIVNLNKSKTIRANLLLGVGYTTIKEPENWQKVEGSIIEGMVRDNYTWDWEKRHGVSLIINPKIEFPLTQYWGLTVSPMVQVNKDRTYFGIGVGSALGLLRPKKR